MNVITQKAKNTKLKKTQLNFFFTKLQKNRNGNIWILCHNFWTNYDLDLLSISNWPSEPQFCKRWIYIWQKCGQKQLYISHLRVTFVSDHSLHLLQKKNPTSFLTALLLFNYSSFLQTFLTDRKTTIRCLLSRSCKSFQPWLD